MQVEDTRIEDFRKAEQMEKAQGVQSSVVYQKAKTLCSLPREVLSEELLSLGGPEAFVEGLSFDGEGNLLVGT